MALARSAGVPPMLDLQLAHVVRVVSRSDIEIPSIDC